MRCCRVITTWLLILGTLALLGPAGALASGPSAGDNQYVDPLAGSNGSSSHHSTPSSGSSSGSSGTQSSAPAPVAQPSTASSSTATASTSAVTTTAATSTNGSTATLPRTGFNSWLALSLGLGMLGSGVAIRRQVRRQ